MRRSSRGRSTAILARPPPSTSGLGRHPFKVVARVRIPLGASPKEIRPLRDHDDLFRFRVRSVADAAEVGKADLGGEKLGSTARGRLAQLGERLPYKQEVGGSIPSPPITTCLRARGRRRLRG